MMLIFTIIVLCRFICTYIKYLCRQVVNIRHGTYGQVMLGQSEIMCIYLDLMSGC
jgi:hypothetical protein